jgi:hypothetical protein
LVTFRPLVGNRNSFNGDIGLENLDVDARVLLKRDIEINAAQINFQGVAGRCH